MFDEGPPPGQFLVSLVYRPPQQQRDGSRRCNHSVGKVSCSISFLDVDCARPIGCGGVHALGIAFFEDEELRSHRF